ncbi:MAG: prenyltransferase [Methanomassiliicoccales archaeon]|nr:MAG: prenyltransferase [Methanomassiliicoccales archaeon]
MNDKTGEVTPFKAFIKLSRLEYLSLSGSAYFIGVVLAWSEFGTIDWLILFLGLLAIFLLHLTGHYTNEYWDFETDKLNRMHTKFSGGTRVLVDGFLERKWAIRAAILSVTCALLIIVILYLFYKTGIHTITLFAMLTFIGWSHAGKPFRLNYKGLGEIELSFLAPLISTTGYYLQTSSFSMVLILACMPLLFILFAQQLMVSLPDFESDRARSKRTLVVLLGRGKAIQTIILSLALAYVLTLLGIFMGLPLVVAGLLLLTLPISVSTILFTRGKDFKNHRELVELCERGAKLVLSAIFLVLIGFVISALLY